MVVAALANANPVTNLLRVLSVQQPLQHRNLTLFPLTGPKGSLPTFEMLDAAIAAGQVQVREKGSGEVNTVRIRNTGKSHVFGMAGEIISGAKQDRMLQNDVLLPPNSAWLDVPVYCTEHGRWSGSSADFGTRSEMAAGRVRARAAQSGSQSEVWDEVDVTRSALKVATPTQAFTKVYEDADVQQKSSSYVSHFERLPELRPDAIGVALAVGGRLVCVDLFSSPHVLRQMWTKLLRSYVIDAVSVTPAGRFGAEAVAEFLRGAARASCSSRPAVGAGALWRLSGGAVSGSALTFRQGVVHIDLFPGEGVPVDGDPDTDAPRLQIRRDNSRD
jgi:hypothetical protein